MRSKREYEGTHTQSQAVNQVPAINHQIQSCCGWGFFGDEPDDFQAHRSHHRRRKGRLRFPPVIDKGQNLD